MRFCGLLRPMALVQSPSRMYFSSVNYRGPKTPKKWVEVKKAKKRARKLLERKDRGSKALVLPPEISPKSLSSAMGIRTLDILKLMIRLGERPWSAEQPINKELVELICSELYFEPVWEKKTSDVDVHRLPRPADMSKLPRRPLVVTIMGHVDHGKTTLLDALRGTNVAAGEVGGITQKVSIFQTKLKNSKETVTFMDTPGHAAFASIRERGTDMTDVACLVVAADDGIQDQTLEAIEYIRKKKVPFFVVVSKVDKNGADPEAVYLQLLQEEIALEKYGGDVTAVEVSAKTGDGLDELEDTLLLLQEDVDPRADAQAKQTEVMVIESEVNRYTGVTCTALVQWGTLRVGQSFVAGKTYGRVKSLASPAGQSFKQALPSFPVVITGFSESPSPGDELITVADEKLGRKIAENRAFMADKAGNRNLGEGLEELEDEEDELDPEGGGGRRLDEGKVLNLIIKADLEGSLEALKGSMEGLPQAEVALRFVKSAVGEMSVADVELAKDSDALLIGFNVKVPTAVRKHADALEVELVESDIIYSVLDECRKSIENLLDPVEVVSVVGEAEVLQCFPLRVGGNTVVAGGLRVQSGGIKIGDSVRVVRDGEILFEGGIKELKKEKVAVKEVLKNMECGIRIDGYDEFKPGDTIHSIQTKLEKKKLWRD